MGLPGLLGGGGGKGREHGSHRPAGGLLGGREETMGLTG